MWLKLGAVLLWGTAVWALDCPKTARPFDREQYELAYRTFLAGGDLKSALETAQAALCQGQDGLWRRRLARVALWLGRAETALEQLTILARSGDREALSEALKIARALGAWETLYRLLKLVRPSSLATLKELAKTALILGRYREAMAWLEAGYGRSGDPEWLLEQAEIAFFLDRTDWEERALARLVRERLEPQAVARLAALYLARGEVERAWELVRPHAEALLAEKNPLPLELAWRLGKLEPLERWLSRFADLSPLWAERWSYLAEGEARFERLWRLWLKERDPKWFRLLLSFADDEAKLERLFRDLPASVARALSRDPSYLVARARWLFSKGRRGEAWEALRRALERGDRQVLLSALRLWIEQAGREELSGLEAWLLDLPDDPFFQLKLAYLVRTERPFLALDLLYHRLARMERPGVAILVDLIDLLQATDQAALADAWRAALLVRFGSELSSFEIALAQLTFRPERLLGRLPELSERAERKAAWRNLLLSLAATISSPPLTRWLRGQLYLIRNRKLPGWNVPFALALRDHDALFREIGREDLPYRDRITILEALGWPERAWLEGMESFDRNPKDGLLYRQLHRLTPRARHEASGGWLSEAGETLTWHHFRLGLRFKLHPGTDLLLSGRGDLREEGGGGRKSGQLQLALRKRISSRLWVQGGVHHSFAPKTFSGTSLALGARLTEKMALEGEGWWHRREGWDISLALAQRSASDGLRVELAAALSDRIDLTGRFRLERFRQGGKALGGQRLLEMTYRHGLAGLPIDLLGTVAHRNYFGPKERGLFFGEGWQLMLGTALEVAPILETFDPGHFTLKLQGSWIEDLGLGASIWLIHRLPSFTQKERLQLQLGYLFNQTTPRTREGTWHLGLSWSFFF